MFAIIKCLWYNREQFVGDNMTEEVIRVLKETRKKAFKEIKNVKMVYNKIWNNVAEEYYYNLITYYNYVNQDDYYELTVVLSDAQRDCEIILTDEGMELLDEMLVKDGFTSTEGAYTKSYSIKPSIIEKAINESNNNSKKNQSKALIRK